MHLETYDNVRADIEAKGFTPILQTRIALYLSIVKGVTLPWLAIASARPATDLGWQATTTQLFRESEALTTLLRVTNWVPDQSGAFHILRITAPVSTAATKINTSAIFQPQSTALNAIALDHALLATVRLTPIIPASSIATEPFAAALNRIEMENGRLLQGHIRMLKDGFSDFPLESRETAIEKYRSIVEDCFSEFLDFLSQNA